MLKLFIIAVLLHSLVSQYSFARQNKPVANGFAQGPEAVEQWFGNLPNAKEKLTKLHFYFHDILSGKNPSAVTIAQSSLNPAPPNEFGVLRMMDDALTVGPEPNSKVIGRAQGIYGSTSLGELGLLMTLNYVFTDDDYKDSTLSILGHNPILHEYREMPWAPQVFLGWHVVWPPRGPSGLTPPRVMLLLSIMCLSCTMRASG